ncbi:MAG TPA: PAS domain-containing sensor histidine kinase, partial [Gillisia sp.]|nr:PAS domain-containing sensor histidine kinase [Gillisia sp.]
DAAGNFIYFNQDWLDYTGLTFEELKEKGWIDLIHPGEREYFRERWQASLDSGEAFEMELRCINKNGKYKWHLSRAEAVKNEDGTIKMWIGTNTEIQKLKEEEKRKGDFLKMVSHELKTPVTSIKGYVQLLLSLLKRDNVVVQGLPLEPSLQRIDHQIKRLTRLISEMLDLSRIEENKLELKKEIFSINDLVNDTVQDIIYTNTQHNIEIQQDFKCNVLADKDRIGQVLINFITNAIKYSPDSRDIVVKVQKHKNNQVAVVVKDKGIGIDKKNHRNIFKRFYRIGGKGEDTYSGFGIGLYLANEIIQRHNGTITVKSKKGKGSDFCFVLSTAQ